MLEAAQLIGAVVIMALLQIVFEALIDPKERPLLSKALSMACFAGALFFVLRFIAQDLLPEITAISRIGM